jgi:hypothetical protein
MWNCSLTQQIPHDKLKTRLKETIHKAFSHRNYDSKFVVLGYNSTYFSNKIQKGKTCYSEEQVISMLEFPQKILDVFQNPHVIYANTRTNSFTIFLLSLFYLTKDTTLMQR